MVFVCEFVKYLSLDIIVFNIACDTIILFYVIKCFFSLQVLVLVMLLSRGHFMLAWKQIYVLHIGLSLELDHMLFDFLKMITVPYHSTDFYL